MLLYFYTSKPLDNRKKYLYECSINYTIDQESNLTLYLFLLLQNILKFGVIQVFIITFVACDLLFTHLSLRFSLVSSRAR